MPLTTHLPLSFPSWIQWWIAPNCIPLLDLFCPELNYNVQWQKATCNFWSFKQWQHTLKLWTSNWCGHWSPDLQYFSMTKILTHWQAHWSKYLSRFNLVICFHPRKLGTKPDTLTRWSDVYLKRGIVTMPYQSTELPAVFTSKQLASSSKLPHIIPALCGSLIMDAERLHSDIWYQLWEDPISTEYLDISQTPCMIHSHAKSHAIISSSFSWVYFTEHCLDPSGYMDPFYHTWLDPLTIPVDSNPWPKPQ